jgi:D-glycero-alpha-D-manno-heptose-7-phosphate kinase
MIIRSKAPLRISFAGGGTDVEPFLSDRGGMVLSTTIDKYAYGSLSFRKDRQIEVTSLDYDVIDRYNLDEELGNDGKLNLVKAVLRRLNSGNRNQGLNFFLHSDAPPGTGLGSSSTMVVALIGLFKHWLHLQLNNYEIADLAFQIERQDLGIKGGKQDHYAATFGGFNFIEFQRDLTIVNPLRIPPDILNELHYNLLLCYTGKSRLSAHIIDTQVENYVRGNENVIQAMEEMKCIAIDMKNALLQGHLDYFGGLVHESWLNKKKMATQISDPHIDELYEMARQNGAIGGKITGAGGGGYMLFYCQYPQKYHLATELEKMGAQVVNFNFDFGGSQTWEVR